MRDFLTVVWKEFHELFLQRGTRRGTIYSMAIFLSLFGILMPLSLGREWVETPASMFYWGFLPFMMVNNVIADSFAGERERHTLETLLASRLPDLPILLGKVATAILYGFGTSMLGMLISLITVNISAGHGTLLLYPLYIAFGLPVVSFLVAALAAGIGVLVSLHAATVRQAQQTVGMAFFVVFLPLLLFPLLPTEWKAGVVQFLQTADLGAISIGALVLLFLVDLVLLAISAAQFRRNRLILD